MVVERASGVPRMAGEEGRWEYECLSISMLSLGVTFFELEDVFSRACMSDVSCVRALLREDPDLPSGMVMTLYFSAKGDHRSVVNQSKEGIQTTSSRQSKVHVKKGTATNGLKGKRMKRVASSTKTSTVVRKETMKRRRDDSLLEKRGVEYNLGSRTLRHPGTWISGSGVRGSPSPK